MSKKYSELDSFAGDADSDSRPHSLKSPLIAPSNLPPPPAYADGAAYANFRDDGNPNHNHNRKRNT